MNKTTLTALCLLYGFLVLYGSLMPFDLTNNRTAAAENLRQAQEYWPLSDQRHTSKVDLVSNFILYVPLGLLLAARGAWGRDRAWVGPVCRALLGGAAVSLIVETLQLFSTSRVASVHDLVANAAGALAGGILGAARGQAACVALEERLRRQWDRRPIALVAGVLLALLACDALLPLLPTLDVSTVKRSIKASLKLMGPAGLAAHPWHHWAVQRVAIYAVLTVLLGAATDPNRPGRWGLAVVFAAAFAVAAEAGKIFIVSRVANPANVAFAVGGAVLGGGVGAWGSGKLALAEKLALAAALIAGYVVYLQWDPFVFSWDPAAVARKTPSGATWLPLYHYAMHGRGGQVVLLVRTLVLVGGLAYALQTLAAAPTPRGRYRRAVIAAFCAGLVGLALELGQFLLPDRTPSLTDVFCFAAGGASGSLLASALAARKTPTPRRASRPAARHAAPLIRPITPPRRPASTPVKPRR